MPWRKTASRCGHRSPLLRALRRMACRSHGFTTRRVARSTHAWSGRRTPWTARRAQSCLSSALAADEVSGVRLDAGQERLWWLATQELGRRSAADDLGVTHVFLHLIEVRIRAAEMTLGIFIGA